MNSLRDAMIDNIRKEYFRDKLTDVQCFHSLKLAMGSWHKASVAFQALWMERP